MEGLKKLIGNIFETAEMIQFKHSVFALPFAFLGVVLGGRGLPPPATAGWVIVAMVGARTAAMAFNRIVDRRIDALNPRTADRALPTGKVSLGETWLLVAVSVLAFEIACFELNGLAVMLSPLVLAVSLGYSFTKRFTWSSHFQATPLELPDRFSVRLPAQRRGPPSAQQSFCFSIHSDLS